MKNLFIIFLIALSFSGCIKNNTVPAYLKINPWVLEVNVNSTHNAGVLTQNFTNAWVYVDNKLLGVFELPCTVPVLKTGSSEIRIYPAILNNGISATKKIYPFVEYYTTYATLESNEIAEISPVTRYKSNAQFWIEDFEGASPNIIEANSSQASMIFENAPNNSNTYGRVYLNEIQNTWSAYTTQELAFPLGSDVYLEVDYYNTNNLVTGLIAVKPNGTTENNINIQMNQQPAESVVWKKIYIDLQELVNLSGGTGFLQSFQAALDDGDAEGLILIDNIKVVHY